MIPKIPTAKELKENLEATADEEILIKNQYGVFSLGFPKDTEVLDKEKKAAFEKLLFQNNNSVLDLAAFADEEIGVDYVAVAVNIMRAAGISEERIQIFESYFTVRCGRKRSGLVQFSGMNSFFHTELSVFNLAGYHPRSVMIVYKDPVTWFGLFARYVVPFLLDNEAPLLPGQVPDLERANTMMERFQTEQAKKIAEDAVTNQPASE